MLKNTRTKTPYSLKTLLPWLLISLGLLILCLIIALNIWLAYHQPPQLASREDVARLQTIVADIKSRLDDGKSTWHDTSSCTVIEPRLFGEEERYFCEVQYERGVIIDTDAQIRRLIDYQATALLDGNYIVAEVRYPTLKIDQGDQYKVKQAGVLDLVIKDGQGVEQNCSVGYILSTIDDVTTLKQQIRCYADTKGTYLKRVDRV